MLARPWIHRVAAIGALVCACALLGLAVVAASVGIRLGLGGAALVAATAGVLLLLSESRALSREAQATLAAQEASEARLRSIVQGSGDVITILDAAGRVVFQSKSDDQILGFEPGALVGGVLAKLIHPDDKGRVLRQYTKAMGIPGGVEVYECRMATAAGEWRDIEAVITNHLDNPLVQGLVINSRDISYRKELERRLTHQSLHDTLTGLPNRALFRDRVHHALALARRDPDRRLAVILIDLDGFASINDSFGHSTGDALLKVTAERLVDCVRPGDTVARLGGDEFAVLLENIDSSLIARQVANRFLDAMLLSVDADGREIFASASVGIAADMSGDGADELLRNADLAMYRAKARGKKRYEVFEPAMHAVVVERLALETDLRKALDRGEFFLLYQPVVNLATGVTAGLEALVRWQHPTRGVVAPGDFITAAEETGLIVPLGRWVLDEACRQLRSWQDIASHPLRMAVNLSARQLHAPGLADHVASALRSSDVIATSLVLEITESMLVDDADRTLAKLQQLNDLGVSLAIDDFGTGYSSLAYLSRLPVDILKIDRTFVAGIGEHDELTAVTAAIVALGEKLGLSLVAEGIEEAGQLAAVTGMGCHFGQGYLLARPMTAAGVETLLLEAAVMDLELLATVSSAG
ncbi:MAG TPA: EAL domain-containing protein [Mycobacteriales bacterium]|nr:EAL domain-containing protein [Mycobacteriales bacterium]